MKKLMIAAAIVCAAALSQGASCAWKLTNVTTSPGQEAVAAGWKGYWMDASTYDTFTGLAANQIAAYVMGNALDDADMTTRSGKGNFNGEFGTWTYIDEEHPQYVKGYIVVFDSSAPANAKYYANTGILEAKVPQSGDMTPGGSFATVTGGWKNVPEPTSGLLMLLGMAGLALRRRRA